MNSQRSATNQLILGKCCRTCGVTKPLDDFYRHPTTTSGRQSSCKECHKTRASAWQRAHPDCHRVYVSAWKTSHPEDVKRLDALTRSGRNQDTKDFTRLVCRVAAITRLAIRVGVLIRPESCSDCGREGVVIDAVHPDYELPLEVVWLCRRCHHRWNLAHDRTRASS